MEVIVCAGAPCVKLLWIIHPFHLLALMWLEVFNQVSFENLTRTSRILILELGLDCETMFLSRIKKNNSLVVTWDRQSENVWLVYPSAIDATKLVKTPPTRGWRWIARNSRGGSRYTCGHGKTWQENSYYIKLTLKDVCLSNFAFCMSRAMTLAESIGVFINHRSTVRGSSLYNLIWRTCYCVACYQIQPRCYWDHLKTLLKSHRLETSVRESTSSKQSKYHSMFWMMLRSTCRLLWLLCVKGPSVSGTGCF